MAISWWWVKVEIINLVPFLSFKVEVVKVIQLHLPIMASKHVHLVIDYCTWCPVSRCGPYTVIRLDPAPLILSKVELVEVIFVVTVIATEHIHAFFIDHCLMWMSGGWWALIPVEYDFLPGLKVDIVLIEVVHPVEPIIPSEYKNRPFVDNWDMSVPW